jgi:hypothetical protein
MLESQMCSRTNKFKTSGKEFLGWHFVSCCFGDTLSVDALKLVLNHKLYLSFEDRTPHFFVDFSHDASNYRKTLDPETPSLKYSG